MSTGARTFLVAGMVTAIFATGCYDSSTVRYFRPTYSPQQQYDAAMRDENMGHMALDLLNQAAPYATDEETKTWMMLSHTLGNHIIRDAQRRQRLAQLRMRP